MRVVSTKQKNKQINRKGNRRYWCNETDLNKEIKNVLPRR